jgi:hypothetical protein
MLQFQDISLSVPLRSSRGKKCGRGSIKMLYFIWYIISGYISVSIHLMCQHFLIFILSIYQWRSACLGVNSVSRIIALQFPCFWSKCCIICPNTFFCIFYFSLISQLVYTIVFVFSLNLWWRDTKRAYSV